MDNLTKAIAEAVRDDMVRQGISQQQLAEQSGIPRVTLRRRLAAASPFTIPELHAVASVLNCQASRYITNAEPAA